MKIKFCVKRVLQAVTILLAFVLAGLLVQDYFETRNFDEYYEDKYRNAIPLIVQKRELEQKLTQIKKEYEIKINGKGTLTFLCMDLSESIYTEIYPRMQEQGYLAMLAVSETKLPGAEGCMSAEQVGELIDAGWSLCLHWDGSVELDEWFGNMERYLMMQNLDIPEQIYFDRGTYGTEYDELLIKHGLKAVVHHQEKGLPALVTQTEEGIWHIGAWGWNQVNARNSMERALEDGAGLVFTIGGKYYYDEEQFEKMLGVLKGYEDEECLYVADISSAYSYRREEEDAEAALQEQLEREIVNLESEVDAINRQILELYGE